MRTSLKSPVSQTVDVNTSRLLSMLMVSKAWELSQCPFFWSHHNWNEYPLCPYDVCSTPSLFETTLAGPCEYSYLGADALRSDDRTILCTVFKWTLGRRLVSGPSGLPGLNKATRILMPSASRGMCCLKIALLMSAKALTIFQRHTLTIHY